MSRQTEFERAAEEWIQRQRDQYRVDSMLLEHLDNRDPCDMHEDDLEEVRKVYDKSSLEWDWEEFLDKSYDDVVQHLEESHRSYGWTQVVTVRIELMGGGPAGWVEIDLDPEDETILGGRLAYNDWYQTPYKVHLDSDEVEAIVRIMGLYPELLLERQ